MTQTGLPDAVIEKLENVFSDYDEIVAVLLYGSRAKGTFRNGSDIDLKVIAPHWTHSDLSRLVTELDDLNLPWMLDVQLDHLIELPALREHIERVGITIYSNEK